MKNLVLHSYLHQIIIIIITWVVLSNKIELPIIFFCFFDKLKSTNFELLIKIMYVCTYDTCTEPTAPSTLMFGF